MTDKTLERRLRKLYEDFFARQPQASRRVNKALEHAELRVTALIAEHSEDGKLDKRALQRILTELEVIERQLAAELSALMQAEIRKAIEEAGIGLNEILLAAGVTAVLVNDEEEADGILAALGTGLLALVLYVLGATFRRKGDDDKNLHERLRYLAHDLRMELERELRKAKGNIASALQANKRVFKDAKWRVERLVETETAYAFRRAVARASETSGAVTALRIIDFPHGKPSVHRRHKCYMYAHADEHGLGTGVYPLGTRKILNPHPQCRSAIIPVLKGG
jgi:hypothetical protein